MFTSNIIINSFYNQLSNNEEAIRGMFANTPIYVFISAVFLAPILEELTFRLTFKKIFNKKWLFIILSGLFFGYLHISTLDNYLELLYIIPYGTLGAVFAYMLEDSKNICVPIAFHFLHNGIFMSLQFFMTFLL